MYLRIALIVKLEFCSHMDPRNTLSFKSEKEELTGGFAPKLLCFYMVGIIVYF
jgi:hypothetical protein